MVMTETAIAMVTPFPLRAYVHLQGQGQGIILLAFQYKNRPHILVPGIDEKDDSRGNDGA